jgi:uncharacterized protein DUF4031
MIHIDPELSCLPNPRWRWSVVTHLFCPPGELDDLHAFALRLGLQRRWFQPRSTMPHYDLAPGKRWQALRLGAVALTREETVAIIRRWRAEKVTL